MDNLDNVLRATEVLTSEWGYAWSPRRITVSSVGVKGKLKRFLDESECHVAISMHSPLPEQRQQLMPAERGVKGKLKRFLDESECHVAISMHSPLPEQRQQLMPAERQMSITEVVELLRQYDFTHQRRCSFEYQDLTTHRCMPVRLSNCCRAWSAV